MTKSKTKRKLTLVTAISVILVLAIAVFIFSICNSSTISTHEFADFENKIQEYGESIVRDYYVADPTYKDLTFASNDNIIEINDQEGNLIGGVNLDGLEKLFEEIDTEAPKLINSSKVSKNIERLFNSAKKIVSEYVSESCIIKDEDKEEAKKAILNMKLVAGKFDIDYAEFGMITYEDTIYISDDVANNIKDEYVFIHELIHVINSVTAKGSKYENSYFNNGGLSEGITDIIAATMTYWCNIYSESIDFSGYLKYFDTAYVLMSNKSFNLLEAYYYPDNYDKLIEMTGEDFAKCIFASVFTLDDNAYSWSNYLLCNYYVQL